MPLTSRIRGAASLAWDRLRPSLYVEVGGRLLDVTGLSAGTRGLVHWQPNWKSRLIADFLARRDGLFVDVGANIGQTLLDYLAAPVRHGYLGFEPSLEPAQHVQRVILRNRLPDCQVVPAALSATNGITELFGENPLDPGASIVPGLRPSRSAPAVTIATLRFDDLDVADPISFIKIDVEGAELNVLMGMEQALKANPVPILCEVLRRDPAADALAFERRMIDLQQFIASVGLVPCLIRKSADLRSVERFEKIDAFPIDAWSSETAELNDYLLHPHHSVTPHLLPR